MHPHRCVVLLALGCVRTGSARPTKTQREVSQWSDNWVNNDDGGWNSQWFLQCSDFDLTQAELPTAPTPLPTPTGTLAHVAIGRGTQNYTCDMSDPQATPVPIGALATLYNASCVAATNPTLLSYLPNIAFSIRLRSLPDFFSSGASSASGLFSAIASSTPTDIVVNAADKLMSGHHFFLNDTTPRFDLDTSNGQFGSVTASKIAESDPPVGASEGSVAWLYLQKMDSYTGSPQAYSEVYRVNTVGGSPPSTCGEARKANFKVQYSAEYWFYE